LRKPSTAPGTQELSEAVRRAACPSRPNLQVGNQFHASPLPLRTHGMTGRTSLRKEGANDASSSSTTSTVAHTLTACTRCRVVGPSTPIMIPSRLVLTARLHHLCSAKHDVIPLYPNVVPATGQTPNANTTTPARASSSTAIMSSISSTRSRSLRNSWRERRAVTRPMTQRL
jgi:hypothetical protein